MKAFLEGLKVVHTWDKVFPGRQIVLQRGGDFYLNHKFSNPPIEQPLIRTHPRTKKKIVNVNPAFSSHII
jgi:alpha-ketoglutarate-dependent taurine dioxygenase